jgi:alpha-beta hydrolase superfamily lysophospholipase
MVRRLLGCLWFAVGSLVFGLVLIAGIVYWQFLQRGAQPQAWHETRLEDFDASHAAEVDTLDEYLALEERLFAQLRKEVYRPADPDDPEPLNRYTTDSLSDPARWPVDWNRTYRLAPAEGVAPRGAALLLHGLTDSPYSLRSIGEHLAARGYDVLGLRLPGHGTAPSGLLEFRVEDMQAAVELAMRDLRRNGPADRPILMVGYSNGAALAVDYAMAALEDTGLPRPSGLVLISPAIAISKFAVLARLRTGLSSVPGFARAAWQDVQLEFDPYKYNSFTFNAAGETFRLTRGVSRNVTRLATDGVLAGFPPVIAFLSTVDSTVRADAVVDVLFEHLPGDRHELVLFDVNRLAAARALLVSDPGPLTQRLLGMPQRPFGLTVVTNVSPQSWQVHELRAPQGSALQEDRVLALEWPSSVFSLSHVALPFPADDPLYGFAAERTERHVQLGSVAVRGENGVLALPSWVLTRQRSNPFHGYLLERVDGFLDSVTAPETTAR